MSTSMVLLLIPLVLIELVMKAVALRDLWTREGIVPQERWLWTAAIVFISTFGWLAYLLIGRQRNPAS